MSVLSTEKYKGKSNDLVINRRNELLNILNLIYIYNIDIVQLIGIFISEFIEYGHDKIQFVKISVYSTLMQNCEN